MNVQIQIHDPVYTRGQVTATRLDLSATVRMFWIICAVRNTVLQACFCAYHAATLTTRACVPPALLPSPQAAHSVNRRYGTDALAPT